MKRKRILSVLLVLVMTCATFLGNGYVTLAADDIPVSEVDDVEITPQTENMDDYQLESEVAYAPPLYNSETAFPEYTHVYVPTGGGVCKIVPVQAKSSGIMHIHFMTSGTQTSDSATLYLTDYYNYDPSIGQINYNQYSNYIKTIYQGTNYQFAWSVPVSKGDVYYILVVGGNNNTADFSFGTSAFVFTTGTRTLYQGTSKWTYASGKNKSDKTSTTYFKVKPDRTGVMSVQLSEAGYSSTNAKVTLCNSSKKAISETVTHNGKKIYFGVKKNTTYYLKVTDACGAKSEGYMYGIKYGMSSATDRSLGSKSKAKKLTRKADATGTLFTATTSTSTDWYKFYVSSKRTTQVTLDTSKIDSGTVTVTFYRGSKKLGSQKIYAGSEGGSWNLTYGTTYGKANSGTYYVKVQKSAKASGKYTIRYDK